MVEKNHKLILDKSIEQIIFNNFKEEDHVAILLGIKNLAFTLIKLPLENDLENFCKEVLSFFPAGIEIIGTIFIYNNNVYEDFEGLNDELLSKLSSKNKPMYYLVTKDILGQTKLEFDDLYFINQGEKTEINFCLDNASTYLKEQFGFCFTQFTIKQISIDFNQQTFFICFGENFVIDYKDLISKDDMSSIEEVIRINLEKRDTLFKVNKLTNYSPTFKYQENFIIKIKKDNHFDNLNEEGGENFYSEGFLFDINNTSSFTTGLKKTMTNIVENNLKAQKRIFFNDIIFPCPLLINTLNLKEVENLEKLIIKDLNYLKKRKVFYPNDFSYLISSKKPHNVHLSLKYSLPETSKTSYVKGIYEYHHYMQDGYNDDGWGCAYRSFQTLYSWYLLNDLIKDAETTPSIVDIQKTLVKVGDKAPKIINSQDWIGAIEVNIVLGELLKIESIIMYLNSGSEIKSKAREIIHHFETVGSPIMMAGGKYAYTIVGINYDYTNGDSQFLILDPHYKDKDEIGFITTRGGISWKTEKLFEKSNFYNLCLPQLPSLIN